MTTGSPASESPQDAAINQLTSALVEATEREASLQKLAALTTESLSREESISYMLEHACMRLMNATSAVLLNEHAEAVHGDTTEVQWLREAAHSRLESGDLKIVDDGNGFHAVLVDVHPSTSPARVIAVGRSADKRFSTGDRRMLTAIADTLTGVLEVADLHDRAIKQAVQDRDYNTATALAQAALPSWVPTFDGMELFARSDSARGAGGDFFTYQVIGGTLHFAVGDVSGKGLPAALVMTTVLNSANAAFQRFGSLGADNMLRAINEDVYDYLSSAGLFVTMITGSYTPGSDLIQVCNAGHSPVLAGGPQGLVEIPASAPPIGVLPDMDFQLTNVFSPAGSLFIVASDGFTEQEDPTGLMLGEERLNEALLESLDLAASEQGTALFDRLEKWADGAEQNDDRTLVLLRRVEDEKPTTEVDQ